MSRVPCEGRRGSARSLEGQTHRHTHNCPFELHPSVAALGGSSADIVRLLLERHTCQHSAHAKLTLSNSCVASISAGMHVHVCTAVQMTPTGCVFCCNARYTTVRGRTTPGSTPCKPRHPMLSWQQLLSFRTPICLHLNDHSPVLCYWSGFCSSACCCCQLLCCPVNHLSSGYLG